MYKLAGFMILSGSLAFALGAIVWGFLSAWYIGVTVTGALCAVTGYLLAKLAT